MRNPSNDRAKPNERTEAPAIPELGASMFAPQPSDPALRRLVHDLANWYQRIEAQLEIVDRDAPELRGRLDAVRRGLRNCAELGVAALGGEVPPARIPQTLIHFVAEDAAAHAGSACELGLETSSPEGDPADDLVLSIGATVLENALLNLVRNARRASDWSEPVGLRWTREGQGVRVEVIDHGAGMDPQALERCLQEGYSTKAETGHGLGLTGVRRDVERAGGRIEFRSAPGQGTTVELFLGLQSAAPAPVPAASDESSPLRHALVVEDDPEVAEVLRLFLESFGTPCEVVDTAARADEILTTGSFDAVILDQGLPDRPGTRLAEEIRQRHPNLVLVLLTGDPSVRGQVAGSNSLDAIGLKPLDRARLQALLEDAVKNHARRQNSSATQKQRPAQA